MKKRNYLRCVSLSTESICPKRKTAIITAMVITENMAAMDMENTVNMAHTATMVALETTVIVSMETRTIIL